MGGSLLVWILGALTLVTGGLLLVMWRRRRAKPELKQERKNTRELVDAYAIPVAYDEPPKRREAEDEPGKICPSCGNRYAYHFRICSRDDSELATLN